MQYRVVALAAVSAVLSSVTWAQQLSDGKSSVSVPELRSALSSVPPGVRSQVSKGRMERYVETYLSDRRISDAARAVGLADRPDIRYRMEFAARDVLIKAYTEEQTTKFAADLPKDLEAMAKERYEADKAPYAVPEAIRAAHILIPFGEDEAAAKAKANELRAQLAKGGDFAALAKANSQDKGSAANGGELPNWSVRGKLVPEFEKAAYALKPGEISDVVRTAFGFHIIKLIEYRSAHTQPFEEVKEQAVERVRRQLIAERRKEWLLQYMGSQPVALDDETYEALKKPD
jgi:peptidyl-prolyl cis-trans isomerase C